MRKKSAKNAEFIGGFGGQNTFFYKKKSCTLAYIKNYVYLCTRNGEPHPDPPLKGGEEKVRGDSPEK